MDEQQDAINPIGSRVEVESLTSNMETQENAEQHDCQPFKKVKEEEISELVKIVVKMAVDETHSSGPTELVGRADKLLPQTVQFQGK